MKSIPSIALGLPVLLAAALAWAEVDNAAEQASVRPGINKKFLNPDLKADEWVNRWEVESREVYAARKEVLEHCGIKKGMVVADVGCGTGLYTRLFAEAVGPDGWVCAVDISSRFLEHVNRWARTEGLTNLSSVFCRDNSISLPPQSVDVVFLCDTYHHFEYPKATNASILRALKPGGSLIMVDFERIPGESREWILGHVRAGKEVFKKEVEAAGFTFKDEVPVKGFKENYLLRFVKE